MYDFGLLFKIHFPWLSHSLNGSASKFVNPKIVVAYPALNSFEYSKFPAST
jgi:hypothetical protein